MCSKIGQYRSANFRSKPALCAMTITASATNEETAAASIRCPATISAVMPVSAVTSGGDGAGRFVERSEDVPEPRDPAVRQVVELDHSKFDDFVLLLVEASRLYIEDDTGFTDLAIGGHERRSRHQAPQNAVIAGIDQRFGHRC
jgi:hypothetical protein